jgi:thiamine-phosphate pyrophosphorylase
MLSQLIDFKLYLITDRKIFPDTSDFIMAVEEALAAGVRTVQLREKDLSTRELLDMAYRFRELTRRYNARLFINDRLDIALGVGADGIHVGNAGIPVRVARKTIKDRLMIGCSTHSVNEAMSAEEEGADFITFGPIFSTSSKLQYGEPVGLESLREVRKRVSLPVYGIGGIKSDNIEEVLDSGASGIALISGILAMTDNRAAAAREYLKKVGERL